MSTLLLLGGLVAAGLTAYLAFCLLFPERLS